jgi:hypothetical protein
VYEFILTHITPLEEHYHNLKKIQLFRREEKPNFNLILLNCEEAIAFTIVIFGHKEVYNGT